LKNPSWLPEFSTGESNIGRRTAQKTLNKCPPVSKSLIKNGAQNWGGTGKGLG
jgi:hypothetical protein